MIMIVVMSMIIICLKIMPKIAEKFFYHVTSELFEE